MVSIFRRIILIFLILLHNYFIFAQSGLKTMAKLPDTGQTKDFLASFGEDSDYLINIPDFTDNMDGTITDNVTKLMWQKTDGGEMTFEAGAQYCDGLSLAGYSDWRLPSPAELFSILNHNNNNPALDVKYFTKTDAEYWWTSKEQINDKSKAWVVNAGGGVGNHPKSETISMGGNKRFHVRAVRDISLPTNTLRYFTSPNETLIDSFTALEWNFNGTPDSMSWEDAIKYCEENVQNNHDDWRMPNIKELQSLSSPLYFNPCVHPDFAQQIKIGKYWSSTTLGNQPLRAWFWDTRYGITTYDLKTTKLPFLMVRNAEIVNVTNTISDLQPLLSPNPAQNRCIISGFSQPFDITIISPAGEILLTQTGENEIDISGLSNGLHFVQVTNLFGKATLKLAIVK